MSWGDWYEDIWDALVAKVKTITAFEDNVFYGEKAPVEKFPSAFVCPGVANSTPKTFRETNWQPMFDIGVVVNNADTKTGMIDAFKLIGQIIDLLGADRTLSGVLNNLECGPVTPYWRGLGRGLEDHWIGVTIRCERKL